MSLRFKLWGIIWTGSEAEYLNNQTHKKYVIALLRDLHQEDFENMSDYTYKTPLGNVIKRVKEDPKALKEALNDPDGYSVAC